MPKVSQWLGYGVRVKHVDVKIFVIMPIRPAENRESEAALVDFVATTNTAPG